MVDWAPNESSHHDRCGPVHQWKGRLVLSELKEEELLSLS